MESTTLNQPNSAFENTCLWGDKLLFPHLRQHLLYNLTSGLLLITLPLTHTKLSVPSPVLSAFSLHFFLPSPVLTQPFHLSQNREWFETSNQAKCILFRVWAKDKGLKLGFGQWGQKSYGKMSFIVKVKQLFTWNDHNIVNRLYPNTK